MRYWGEGGHSSKIMYRLKKAWKNHVDLLLSGGSIIQGYATGANEL